jgi:hypothetical protein
VLGKSKLAAQGAIKDSAYTRFLIFYPTAMLMTLFSMTSGASRSSAFRIFEKTILFASMPIGLCMSMATLPLRKNE